MRWPEKPIQADCGNHDCEIRVGRTQQITPLGARYGGTIRAFGRAYCHVPSKNLALGMARHHRRPAGRRLAAAREGWMGRPHFANSPFGRAMGQMSGRDFEHVFKIMRWRMDHRNDWFHQAAGRNPKQQANAGNCKSARVVFAAMGIPAIRCTLRPSDAAQKFLFDPAELCRLLGCEACGAGGSDQAVGSFFGHLVQTFASRI